MFLPSDNLETVPQVDELQAWQRQPAALLQEPLRLPDGVLLHGERLAGDPLLESRHRGHQLPLLLPLLLGERVLEHAVESRLEVGVEARRPTGLAEQSRIIEGRHERLIVLIRNV